MAFFNINFYCCSKSGDFAQWGKSGIKKCRKTKKKKPPNWCFFYLFATKSGDFAERGPTLSRIRNPHHLGNENHLYKVVFNANQNDQKYSEIKITKTLTRKLAFLFINGHGLQIRAIGFRTLKYLFVHISQDLQLLLSYQ